MITEKINPTRFYFSDIKSGLVVFLVALPLCLGISFASGAPVFAGIVAGVIGGIITGFLSNSALGVSGPAAGLTVIVATSITQLGGADFYSTFLSVVVISGIFQFIAGYIKAGVIAHYFPSTVIKGMLAAIGIILILTQVPHALGYDKNPEGEWLNYMGKKQSFIGEILLAVKFHTMGALIISIVSILILIFWEIKTLKKYSMFKFIPGAVVVVVIGVLLNEIFQIFYPDWVLHNEDYERIGAKPHENNHLVKVPSFDTSLPWGGILIFPNFEQIGNISIWLLGLKIAIVASLETLLCVEATDKIDPEKRVTPVNRELKAQGIGNILSGLLGGIPITQVVVRSTANLEAGSKSKWSAVYHGVFLLFFALFLPNFLNKIPLASLAAILILIGYKLTKISLYQEAYQKGFFNYTPFIITILAILFTDLLIGILIGSCVAIFFILRANIKNPFKVEILNDSKGAEYHYLKLSEEMSFLNTAKLKLTLNQLKPNCTVKIDGSNSVMIDENVVETIRDFCENAKTKNIKVELKGIVTKY